ncbi:MAG TPA: BTAD domain-containing putative transcriptional regulator, partial [Solirubrobacteraceae bacterium]|nr:BTAD domain-containing putative transcriptional regulator [Solirubrobacteraceae bacterium]
MEFRILGPLEVRDRRGVVTLGGSKPRAVLAVLLLHPNEPVSAERLALALWGEDAAAGAVRTVQVHVSRLRKALGDPDVIATTPAGYRLRVLPEELDALRFARGTAEGRSALERGDPGRAAALLREALALWRGPALGDLAFEPFAQAEIARLEEQRLSALEARIEAELACGLHRALAGELQQLVADHPTREGFAHLRMLALYRSGRQAEALDAYREARTVLVAEVGVEPGPELRHLHEAILRQDPSLNPPVAAELPAELDADAAAPLIGRDAALARLRAHWEQARMGGGRLVAVVGGAGMGKTRLAAELAGDVHRNGADVLYGSGRQAAATVAAVLERALSASRPTLVVVDDADRAGTEVPARLAKAAQKLAGVPVLVVATAGDAQALGLNGHDALLLEPLGADAVR